MFAIKLQEGFFFNQLKQNLIFFFFYYQTYFVAIENTFTECHTEDFDLNPYVKIPGPINWTGSYETTIHF